MCIFTLNWLTLTPEIYITKIMECGGVCAWVCLWDSSNRDTLTPDIRQLGMHAPAIGDIPSLKKGFNDDRFKSQEYQVQFLAQQVWHTCTYEFGFWLGVQLYHQIRASYRRSFKRLWHLVAAVGSAVPYGVNQPLGTGFKESNVTKYKCSVVNLWSCMCTTLVFKYSPPLPRALPPKK